MDRIAYKHTLKEMEHFFTTYKQIQNKVVEVSGFEGKDAAHDAVKKSIELYKKEFSK